MAERLGVEPSQPFNRLYALAVRCITVLPTFLKLVTPPGVDPGPQL
jgi:hypothetical protein